MRSDEFEAGSMRSRVILQARAEGPPEAEPGGAGDELVSWLAVGTYRAEVVELSGRELWNAQQVKATISHRIRLRRVAELDPGRHRIIYRGTEVLNPEWVDRVDGRDEFLEVFAGRLVGEAPEAGAGS